MNKQQTLDIIEKNDIKKVFIDTMVRPLWSDNSDVVEVTKIKLSAYILKCAADLAGFKDDYTKFKLVAVSAWENDETHIRHLSCTNEFYINKLEIGKYTTVKGDGSDLGRTKYKKGTPWEPGMVSSPTNGTTPLENAWSYSTIDQLLDYTQCAVLNYYLGTPAYEPYMPKKEGTYASSNQITRRHFTAEMIGLQWGLDSFIYHLAELKGENTFNNEGAVIEITLDPEQYRYYVLHVGTAYITDPQLVIESHSHEGICENVYL